MMLTWKGLLRSALPVAALCACASGAKAAVIAETITFTASGFTPGPAPFDPVSGSFTVTFDAMQD